MVDNLTHGIEYDVLNPQYKVVVEQLESCQKNEPKMVRQTCYMHWNGN